MLETERTFIFIGGAEGSGTTLLLRLLSAPYICASLGGNYQKVSERPEALQLAGEFERVNRGLWDRKRSFREHEESQAAWHEVMRRILDASVFAEQTHFLFKRSFPFSGPRDQYTPDLWDVVDFLPDTRFVVIHRNPCSSTFSALRRGFDTDLRRLAVACAEHLTWLAAQIRAIGTERFHIVSYEKLCKDPGTILEDAARFCGIPNEPVRAAAAAEGIDTSTNSRVAATLDARDVSWLTQFFERRRKQWDILGSEYNAVPGAFRTP